MTPIGFLQILAFFGIILLLTKPVGLYMARVVEGRRTFLHPLMRPVEVLIYRICGVKEDQEQRWTEYAGSVLAFSFFAFLFVYAFLRLQGVLPLNPQGFGASLVSPDRAHQVRHRFRHLRSLAGRQVA